MANTFADFPAAEVALGRARVALGATFFNAEFPGWQQRIINAGNLLYMRSHDWDAAAIAAWRRLGPGGEMLFTHGDVGRAYPGRFDTVAMGCTADKHVGWEVLDLCWKEAARTTSPLIHPSRLAQFRHRFEQWRRRRRARSRYGHELFVPPPSIAGCMGST